MAAPINMLGETLGLLFKEGKRRLLLLALVFWVVALAPLPIGMLLPKRWDSSTVILVEGRTIIQPLMEGRAVATDVSNQTALLAQTMKSRRVLREVLTFGGWLGPGTDPLAEERLLGQLQGRISLDNPRPGLVRISYHDKDPELAYRITKKLAEIYIREGTAAQERESREAFDFIDKQVREYSNKLAEAHQAVLNSYRGQQEAARPLEQPVGARGVQAPANTPERQEAQAELATLEARLQQMSKPPTPQSRQAEEQLAGRVRQVRTELERALAKYTPEHPEVRRLHDSLSKAEAELRGAQNERMAREQEAALNDAELQTLRNRVEELRGQVGNKPLARRRVVQPSNQREPMELTGTRSKVAELGEDTEFSELMRRYEATRDVYQDLLKRRENARVSMDLDIERRGLTLRVEEPAELPVVASSMRLLHFSAIGMTLATLTPVGLLFAMVQFDGRLRSAQQVSRLARVPVIGSIPYAPSAKARRRNLWRAIAAAVIVVSVFAIYIATFIVKTS